MPSVIDKEQVIEVCRAIEGYFGDADHTFTEAIALLVAAARERDQLLTSSFAPILLDQATINGLSPGIRDLVVALAAAGCCPTDSGDGSNHHDGMQCGLPYRMVAVVVLPNQRPDAVLGAVQSMVDERDEGMIVEMATPEPGAPDIVLAMDANHQAICEAAGYVAPTLDELTNEASALDTLIAWEEWAKEHEPHAEDCSCPWCTR